MRVNITELLRELEEELEEIDEIVNKKAVEEESDEDVEEESDEDENENSDSMLEKVAEYLQLENYNRDQVKSYLSGLSKILKEAGLLEVYRIGALLVYLSENRKAFNELSEELESMGY
jgi:transcriptional regulator of heat shock response